MKGYSCIGLDGCKTNENIGSIIRLCGNYDVSLLTIARHRYSKHPTDSMKHAKHMPILQVDDLHSVIPFDCKPVAVELVDGAKSITNYVHPKRAFYVFGAEDATLGNRVLSWCKDVIYIPTNKCLNLAMCVNVVLYDRLIKTSLGGERA